MFQKDLSVILGLLFVWVSIIGVGLYGYVMSIVYIVNTVSLDDGATTKEIMRLAGLLVPFIGIVIGIY